MKLIRRGALHVASGSTLALMGATDLACSSAPPGDFAVTEGQATPAVVDQGYLEFTYQGSSPLGLGFVPFSSPDEFVHVGEALDVRLSAYTLWFRLYPGENFPTDIARASALRADFRVIFQKSGATVGELRTTTGAWTGSDAWSLVTTTPSFTVPSNDVDEIAFEVTITDSAEGGRTVNYAADDFPSVPVFGGELPLRHVLFDTDGSTLRQRIIERTDLFRDAYFTISYSDWRANTIFDSAAIDRRIGKGIACGRFGQSECEIFGDIAYEVFAGVGHDQAGWYEQKLLATPNARVVPYGQGRVAYEGNARAYGNSVNVYFHIRAYLVADYSKYTRVTEQWYADGQRLSLGERWDNLNGQAGKNYDFALTDAP
jgi:hypothetical protein